MSKRKRSDTATDILTKLTCPVCIDYFTKPTYNCIKGHSICINCFQNLARTGPICPMCRSKYPANPTRNLTVENMLECFPTSCKFSAHGCKETLNLGNRLEHEKICPFDKEVSCPIFNFVVNHEINSVPDMCTWRNSIDSLIEHLYTAHDLKIDGEPEKEVTLNWGRTLGSDFIFRKKIIRINNQNVLITLTHLFDIYELNVMVLVLNKRYNVTVKVENEPYFYYATKPCLGMKSIIADVCTFSYTTTEMLILETGLEMVTKISIEDAN